jgi:MFS transporter, DHA2 family, multidrug resistance protein
MSLTDHAVIHPQHRAMMMATLMLVTIIHWTDMTIAVVALPSMQGALGASREQISWVITSYVVAAAIATPPAAFLASRFGRKNIFLFSVTVFTLASMLCGFAQSLPQLVFFRIVQGAAGGLISPLSQATMLDAYPREKMGSAMATFSIGTMVGPILAPTIGGWLTEYYDWRWVFFINLPIGILALVGVWRYVPKIQDMARPKFDAFGFFLLCVVIIALQLMLDRGVSKAWFQSPEIIIEAALAALCLYMFIVQLVSAKDPFISLAIFKDFNYTTTMIFSFLMGLSMLATMTLSPNFLQVLLGIPPMTTGFLMIPRTVAMLISMQVVGRLVNIIDPRLIILAGLAPMAYGYWLMAGFNLDTGSAEIIISGLWQGFGMGLTFVPMTIIAFSTLAPQYRAEASGMMNLTRSIGSSIGISAMVTILARSSVTNQDHLREFVNPYVEPFKTLSPGVALQEASGAIVLINGEVMRQSTMIGYTNCFLILSVLTLLTMPFVFIMRKPPPLPTAPSAPVTSAPPGQQKTSSPQAVESGIEPKPA